MFELSRGYSSEQMKAYGELQEKEFSASDWLPATKHQREVGTGYFDSVLQTVQGLMLQLLLYLVLLKKSNLLKSS